jgi:hypothetical protein
MLMPMPMLLLLFLMLLLLLVVLSAAAERILQDDPQTNTSAIRRYLPIMIGRS